LPDNRFHQESHHQVLLGISSTTSNMTTQASRTVVILQDSKDWIKWIDIIKTASEKYDLWNHINPETPATTLPALVEPPRPTPSTVLWPPLRTPAIPAGATPESAPTRYSELDSDQREALRMLNEEYNRDIKRYDKKVEASADLKSKIQESVHKDNFEYTTNCASVWEMLCKLKARFAPTDKAKELEVITDWQKVTKKPEQSTDIEHWLQKVETTYDRAVLIKIPDVDGTRAHYAFCNAVATLHPTFATMWEIKLLKDDIVPFKEIVSEFRDLYRIVKQRSRGRVSNSTFSASFQGQAPDPDKPMPLCLCGEHHYYAQCHYLVPSTRPVGWKPVAAI
jgi:hypothetical protein